MILNSKNHSVMKPLLVILILTILVTFNSCERTEEYPFEAKVLGKNSDCGLFAIQFTKNIQQANEIAGTLFTEYIFIAKNLPTDLQVDGLSIILNIRRIQNSELSECTDLGPSYPWIYVLNAKVKQ
jgi:hypothetical protein